MAGWRRPFRSAIAIGVHAGREAEPLKHATAPRVATVRTQHDQDAKGGALLEQGSAEFGFFELCGSFFGERAAELKNNSALPR